MEESGTGDGFTFPGHAFSGSSEDPRVPPSELIGSSLSDYMCVKGY